MGKPPDDNDLLQQGRLPADPEEGAAEMPAPPDGGNGASAPAAAPAFDLGAAALGAFLGGALDRMEARADGRECPIPLPWLKVAEALAGGLRPGLHILVGNTGSGKTQWALQVALHAAVQGTPVLYIGLEMGKLDLAARLLGLAVGHKWSGLFLGKDRAGLDLAHNKAPALAALPFYMEEGTPRGWHAGLLYARAKALRERHPDRPPLLVLDFLQLVAGDERELRERIGTAAYTGRAAARALDAAVLLVSSTSRENYAKLEGEAEKRTGNNKPREPPLGEGNPARLVGLGKESGEVEYAADTVLVLARLPWGSDTPPPEGSHVWLAAAKVRAGRPSWVEMRFDGGRFTEADAGGPILGAPGRG